MERTPGGAATRSAGSSTTPITRPASLARGFTLLEMMSVLAVTAVVLTLAVPSFSGMIGRQRAVSTMHLLAAHLALARSTAVTRSRQVVVCPGERSGCRNDGVWSAGWIVFLDADRDRQPGTPADLLRIEQRSGTDALAIRSTRHHVRYQADGRSANSNLTLNLCAGDLLQGQLVVNNTGRVRSTHPKADTPCPAGRALP